MMRRWAEAGAALLLAAAGCVSFDPAGAAVPDVTGTYTATITLNLSNEFESRTDTITISLALRGTGERGRFTGSYLIMPSDTGPLAGALAPDGSLAFDTLGAPPKPIGGVRSIRSLYPWCNFLWLGMSAVRGTLAGDTLRASAAGSLLCLYQVNGGTQTIRTDLTFAVEGVR